MALDEAAIAQGVTALAAVEPAFAAVVQRIGPPGPRIRPPGFETLLRAIVSQQLSTAAAAGIWRRLEAALGTPGDPAVIGAAPDAALRAAGLSRRKIDYVRSLAAHVEAGSLALAALPADEGEAVALLSAVRGIGRWSAEIYLLFAEGRPDVFPAGDLALQVEAGRLFAGGVRLAEPALRAAAERWRPWRGVAALLLWHHYSAQPL